VLVYYLNEPTRGAATAVPGTPVQGRVFRYVVRSAVMNLSIHGFITVLQVADRVQSHSLLPDEIFLASLTARV